MKRQRSHPDSKLTYLSQLATGPLVDLQGGGMGMSAAATDADTLLLKYAVTGDASNSRSHFGGAYTEYSHTLTITIAPP